MVQNSVQTALVNVNKHTSYFRDLIGFPFRNIQLADTPQLRTRVALEKENALSFELVPKKNQLTVLPEKSLLESSTLL